jgi:hypothetical protein
LPTYDLHCQSCGKEFERISTIAARYDPCACGGAVEQVFKHSVQATPFAEYFDIGLGETVTSFADRWRHMRQKGLQYRDLPAKGELSARRDQIEQQKREQAHS